MEMLESFTWDELQLGQQARFSRTITEESVRLFAAATGDVNPVHLDEAFAAATPFQGRIAHGMLTAGLVSAAIALVLPGPGSVYVGQELSFDRPVRIGDTITVELAVLEKIDRRRQVKLSTLAKNQLGKKVLSGVATVQPSEHKVRIARPMEP